MSYWESKDIRTKGVDPDLVGQFESLTYQFSTPTYKTPLPFHARFPKPALIENNQKYPVDNNRIYITGYSMGGYVTWSMIARYPDLFAAASPICGCGDPTTVSKFVYLPF
ncbi:prolyl oligopeptidase family serine peptidase [Gimesia alba]|nr:prolyl oligopeptidase family serine peptidase [Gimesia alba]